MTVPGALERAYREEWTAIVAALAAGLGDLQAAEDAVSEAFVAAARTWPRDGVPPKPGAWLTVTARRKAIDQLRIRQHTSERGLSSLIATAAGIPIPHSNSYAPIRRTFRSTAGIRSSVQPWEFSASSSSICPR